MTKICPIELKFSGFVVLRKLCVSSFSSFIYLQYTLKLFVGWLAKSEELIATSQTAHS